MARQPRYTLNVNAGEDVIHRDGLEECNVDDSEGKQTIDAATAEALLNRGVARRCRHCYNEEGLTT